jgi:hypothetical protein
MPRHVFAASPRHATSLEDDGDDDAVEQVEEDKHHSNRQYSEK